MAGRRLAISSLLCADDDAPSAASGASHSSPPYSPPRPGSLRPVALPSPPRHSFQSDKEIYLAIATTDNSGSSSRDVLPPAPQSRYLTRHTPSPHPEEAMVHRPDIQRDHYPRQSDYSGGIVNSPGPSYTSIDNYEHTSYHGRHQHLQADSSHDQFSTRGRDSYELPSCSPTSSYSVVRPSSSWSTQHESSPTSQSYLPTYSSHPQSPVRSPASAYSLSLQRHPSHSPVMSTRPNATSPVHYIHPLTSPPGAYLPSSSYYPPVHTSVRRSSFTESVSPPLSSSSSQQFAPARTSQTRSTSNPDIPPMSESPPMFRNSSAASLPNILNAPSPSSRSGGGLAGLEALAQAATQERRRLSGEIAGVGQAGDDVGARMSSSPITQRSELRLEHVHETYVKPSSPVVTRSPTQPRRDISTFAENEPVAEGGSRLECEPPRKRRRSSSPSSHSVPTAHTLLAAPPPALPAPASDKAESPVIASPAVETGASPLYHHPGVVTRALQVTTIDVTPDHTRRVHDNGPAEPMKRAPSDSVGQASSPMSDASQLDIGPAKRPHSDTVVPAISSGMEEQLLGSGKGAERRQPQDKKDKKKREKPSSKKEKAKGAPAEQVRNDAGLSKDDAREQDPHEWLLEHYSSPRAAHFPSPAGASKPTASPYTLRPAFPDQFKAEVSLDSPHLDAGATAGTVATPNTEMRTPTPLTILEMELKEAEIPRQTAAQANAHDSDITMELDMAVSATPPPAAGGGGDNDTMELDVEDELLMLLDDEPRKPHSHSKHTSVIRDSSTKHVVSPSAVGAALDTRVSLLSMARQTSHPRDSMPPPASPVKESSRPGSAQPADRQEATGGTANKKKEAAEKSSSKPKAAAKPKAKSTAKSKPKAAKDGSVSAASPAPGALTPSVSTSSVKGKKATPLLGVNVPATKRGASAAAASSRSRSASVMPSGSVAPEADGKGILEAGAEGVEKDVIMDDKLYCVCKTSYDEDRVMIACDRCDEWYHTQCVNMPDLEVDLVDQFFCPPCINSNPHLHLKTTYKRRCFSGLQHPHPSSPSACHKPARGAFSKYCSDECGVLYMQSRLDVWKGAKGSLWGSFKDARKREGVVVCVKDEADAEVKVKDMVGERTTSGLPSEVVKSPKTQLDWFLARLDAQLAKIASNRDHLKKEMEIIQWREKVIQLAATRADQLDECGWDQRLCFGDEEYAEFGVSVLESYEAAGQQKQDGDAMQVDGSPVDDGEWWCNGKKKCERHAGWQKLRATEIQFERDTRFGVLQRLTVEEREIRKQIEDVMDPKARASVLNTVGPPLQPLNGDATPNGPVKSKASSDANRKGKKKT